MLRPLLFGLVLGTSAVAFAQTPPGTNPNQQQGQPSSTQDPGDPTAPTAAAPVSSASPAAPSFVPGTGDAASQTPHRVLISSTVMEDRVLHKVEPVRPMATPAGMRGSVVVITDVSRDGRVKAARVASGPSVFRASAIDAVRQYVYKPYVLQGTPIEVQTAVTVLFR